MPRKEQGWITFQASPQEMELLEELCKNSQRTKTEILRELLRGLDQYSRRSPTARCTVSPPSKRTKKAQKKSTSNHFTKTLEVNSRNVMKCVVTEVVRTEVNTQITLKVLHEVDLTSVITTDSANELNLNEGAEAYAVINSNNIVIAKKELCHRETMQIQGVVIEAPKQQELVTRGNGKGNK